MKSISDHGFGKLLRAFSAVYTENKGADVGEPWLDRAMARIRSSPPMYPETGYLESLQQLVWQLSPVAVILVLLLGATLLQVDFTADYELAKTLAEDPLDLSLLGEYTISQIVG